MKAEKESRERKSRHDDRPSADAPRQARGGPTPMPRTAVPAETMRRMTRSERRGRSRRLRPGEYQESGE
jgi:hypothetical protein